MDRCYDRLCYYETQQNIKWWLIPFAILLLLLAAVAVVIISFVVVPQVKTNVADARLDTFAFAGAQGGEPAATSFFTYNISVALRVGNPNRAMSIKHTKPLVATFVFHDRRLHNLTVVEAGHKHQPGKTEVHLLHAGGLVPGFLLGAAAAEDFKKQNATGMFKLEVRLSGEIKYQRVATAMKRKLSMSCPVGLQLAPRGPEIVLQPRSIDIRFPPYLDLLQPAHMTHQSWKTSPILAANDKS
nr:unnamed protein product [Digitaria exilis]